MGERSPFPSKATVTSGDRMDGHWGIPKYVLKIEVHSGKERHKLFSKIHIYLNQHLINRLEEWRGREGVGSGMEHATT